MHVQTYTTTDVIGGERPLAAPIWPSMYAVKRRDATHFQTGL